MVVSLLNQCYDPLFWQAYVGSSQIIYIIVCDSFYSSGEQAFWEGGRETGRDERDGRGKSMVLYRLRSSIYNSESATGNALAADSPLKRITYM